MKYQEVIPQTELDSYEIVENWLEFLRPSPAYTSSTTLNDYPKQSRKVFKCQVSISGDYPALTFSECFFEDGVTISSKNLEHGIRFKDCWATDIEVLPGAEIKSSFQIHKSDVGTLSIAGTTAEYISIESTSVGTMHLFGTEFKLFTISGDVDRSSCINECFINTSFLKGRFLSSTNVSFDKLSITGSIESTSSVIIDNSLIRILDVFSLRNNGLLRLRGIRTWNQPATLHVSHCNLGKAEFSDLYLKGFEQVFIGLSQIVDCSFVNVTWPEAIRGDVYSNTDESLSIYEAEQRWNIIDERLSNCKGSLAAKSQRETYRQLKYALSKQGDSINEQRFHIQEMRAYDACLEWREAFWTKLIIKGSLYTSEFGQSFLRPLLFLLGIHLILLWIAIAFGAIPHLHFSIDSPTQAGASEGVYQYFFLINPLHKNEDQFLGWTIIWDVLMRISASYMLYNIIRATRRFIK